MIEEIDAATMGVLRLALDAASLRHRVIAHNIANANTEGYAPLRVNFEEQFDAVRSALGQSQPIDRGLLEGLRPVIAQDGPLSGGATDQVALDLEVARLAQNSVHYQALLRGAAKHLSILGIAVTEGKR
jgi:flagellar basal-body rod protein FlgB